VLRICELVILLVQPSISAEFALIVTAFTNSYL